MFDVHIYKSHIISPRRRPQEMAEDERLAQRQQEAHDIIAKESDPQRISVHGMVLEDNAYGSWGILKEHAPTPAVL